MDDSPPHNKLTPFLNETQSEWLFSTGPSEGLPRAGQRDSKEVILKINSFSFGDTLCATPTLRKLAQAYAKKIIVCSAKPFLFENNPYVKFHIKLDDFEDELYKEYEVLNTFNSIGGPNKLGIQTNYTSVDIRRIHCSELGFDLGPEELHCDYYPGEVEFGEDDMEFLNTRNYIVIHIGQNWPSRTWPKGNYESLIKRLNDSGYDVALVGFDVGVEPGSFKVEKSCYDFENFNFNGVSFMNRTTLDQDLYITKNAKLCITMDTGQLHLAGCTDVEILYMGASVNPLWRAPFRNGSQDYKMTFVGGSCAAFCASDITHSVMEHGTINMTPPLPFCLENRPTYECQPSSNQVFEAALKILNKNFESGKKKSLRFAIYTSFYNTGWNAKSVYQDLCNQTYGNWKWFIADDFSADDTKQIILDIASKDERVIFCEQEHKREMYWNSQKFISEDCDYVILCDSDDGMYPKALSVYNHMLSLNPDVFSFAFWHHQYLENTNDKKNIANCDFSFCEGDWYNYLSGIEKDREKLGDFDWGRVRSFRCFGGLRGYKNSKRIEEVKIENSEKSIYEDSVRALHLQKYGSFMLFPRPFYKLLNNKESESREPKTDVHKLSKSNYLNYLKNTEPYQHHKISNKYTKYFDEMCALNLSSLNYETQRKNISLITNKNITEEEKANIQDLYFDHDFYVNEYNENIDYYFLFLNSFNDNELVKIFNKFEGQNELFEVNCYCLLDKPDDVEKDLRRVRRVCLGKPFSWNIFCRNFTVKFNYKKEEKEKVLVKFGSSSLGDSLGWIPYVEEFRKQNDYDVYCFTFNNDLYEKSYPRIKFLSNIEECDGFDNVYNIGWFDDTPQEIKCKNLQYTASYYLGLEHKEIKPIIDIENKKKTIEGKYVCIATQSTAQAKYWNNPKGWEQTIKYLNSLGYSVVCVDKHSSFGKGEEMNYMPEGVIDRTGDLPLQERITDIYNCEFFVGLGSGLSWLAWGLGKEVILISGFSDSESEFYTPHRVINKEVCNSCWNKEEFDKGNWSWCPYHEGTEREFECSKEITFEMVKEEIDQLVFDQLIKTLNEN